MSKDSPITRTERLLALLLMQQLRDAPQRDRIKLLNLADFSNVEIADILDTTAQVVATSLYESRRIGSQRASKRRSRSR